MRSAAQLTPRLVAAGLTPVLIVVHLLGSPAPARAAADSAVEAQFAASINQERAGHGLAALQVADDLTAVARRHSRAMADSSELRHNPSLASDVGGWDKLGENVGRGHSAESLHTAFMASGSHRGNILDPEWTEVGIGVVIADDRIWVTQIFRLPTRADEPTTDADPEPRSTPRPAPPTEPDVGSSSDSTDQSGTGQSDTDAASDGSDREDRAGEPAPEPPQPVPEPPLAHDRITLILARLQAAEEERRLSDIVA